MRVWLGLAPLLGLLACNTGADPEVVSDLNLGFYECQVQPLMDRSCAFSGCHGNPARPLSIFSTSKVRIVTTELRGEPLTDKELCSNFYRALAFATPDPSESQLITKPTTLDGYASQYHAGNYMFGPDDPEALCLTAWMQGDVQPLEASRPPAACALPWRQSAQGIAPECTPREVDCRAVTNQPDPVVGGAQ